MNLELRHLRYFVAVAEELHFGKAAKRLHLSQPPLSQQIRDLEAQLGVRLFERTQRRVTLTEPGTFFLEDARDILQRAERAVRTVQRAAKGQIGRLAIGFVPTADCTSFPDILREFGTRHSEVELELHNLYSDVQAEWLRDKKLDVGFLRQPIDARGLQTECFLREPLVVAVGSSHRLAKKASIAPPELAGEAFVMFARESSPGFYDLLTGFARDAGFELRSAHDSETMQTTLGLVAAGLGISLMPASIRRLHREGVEYKKIRGQCPLVEMSVAFRNEPVNQLLSAFLDETRKRRSLALT